MTNLVWALAMLITAGAVAVQGTVGLGFALISVPLLALLHPDLAPVPQLFIMLPIGISMALRERHAIDLTGVWWLLVGRIPGAFLGVFLLGVASGSALDLFIGIIVLAAVAVIGTGYHVRRTPTTKLLAGTASGATGVVATIGGPAIALVYTREEAQTIRSTLAAVFSFGVSTSILFRWWSGNVTLDDVRVAVVLLPAAAVGLWIAIRYRDRVSREHVRLGVLIVCASSATALIARSVLSY
jgi:uncharacterized membrane protein YfcA